jgi:hypothetical protein
VSLVGVGEIAAHMAPARPELRSFLEEIGPHWVPVTNDPFQVIAAQSRGDQHAGCISANLSTIRYSPQDFALAISPSCTLSI